MGSPEQDFSHVEFVPIHAMFDILSGESSRSRETVLGAVHRRTGEHVGVRRPSLEFATSPAALRRTIALDHPNILRVRTVLQDKEGIYFVTEWAEGGSLARRLADGALPEERQAAAALQIGRGLRYLHGAGAAPVDLGLDQILEAADGTFKLGGFGLHEDSGEETSVPGEGGSEPFRRRVQDDLRAFGRTVRRLGGDGPLPNGLGAIAERCLEDDPARRFADASELVAALERALKGIDTDSGRAPSAPRTGGDGSRPAVRGVFPWVRTAALYDEQGEPMRGGMGTVRMAVERSTGRRVAIKRLLPDASRDEEGLARFLREASSIANLDHPHILQLFQPGRDENGDYLVLEWAAGGSLREKLDRTGPLSVEEVLDVARKIGGALAFAHKKGVVHRDIKPHNILLTETGEPKLADFGLARAVTDHTLSSSHAGGGSPLYMAPEQHEGSRRADERSDLYSLGKTLYHLVTGLSPSSPQAKNVPPRLRRAVMRCIEEDPARRPASAEEFLRELGDRRSPVRGVAALVLVAAVAAAGAFAWQARDGGTSRSDTAGGDRSAARSPGSAAVVAPLPSVVLAGLFGADDEPLAPGGETSSDVVEVRLDLENVPAEAREGLRVEVLRGGEPVDPAEWSRAWEGDERLVLNIPIEGRTNRLQVRVPDLGFESDVLELTRAAPLPSVVGVEGAARMDGAPDRYLTSLGEVELSFEVAKAAGIARLWLGRGDDRREVALDSGAATAAVPVEEGANDFRWYWPSPDEPLGSGSFTIVADATPPSVTVEAPRAGAVTNRDAVRIEGRVEDAHRGDEVAWRLLRGGEEVASGRPHTEVNGAFEDEAELPLAGDGAFVLEVAAADRAGNRSDPTGVPFRVDLRPPSLADGGRPAFRPVLGAGRRLEAVDVAGRADEELSAVRVNGAPATLLGDGRFEAKGLPARGGEDAYRLVLVDAAGNASPELSFAHGIDVTPPTATLSFVGRDGRAVLRVVPSEPLSRLSVAGTAVTGSALRAGSIEVDTGRSLDELTTWKSGPGPTISPIEVSMADDAGHETALQVVVCPVDGTTAVRCRTGAGGAAAGTERCSTCGGEYCPRTGDRGRRTREDGQVHAHPITRDPATGHWVELDCWMLDPQCRYCGWVRSG